MKESIGIKRKKNISRQLFKNVYWNESKRKLDTRHRKEAHIHWGSIPSGVGMTVKTDQFTQESCEVEAITLTLQEIGALSSEQISSRSAIYLVQQITGNSCTEQQCKRVILETSVELPSAFQTSSVTISVGMCIRSHSKHGFPITENFHKLHLRSSWIVLIIFWHVTTFENLIKEMVPFPRKKMRLHEHI